MLDLKTVISNRKLDTLLRFCSLFLISSLKVSDRISKLRSFWERVLRFWSWVWNWWNIKVPSLFFFFGGGELCWHYSQLLCHPDFCLRNTNCTSLSWREKLNCHKGGVFLIPDGSDNPNNTNIRSLRNQLFILLQLLLIPPPSFSFECFFLTSVLIFNIWGRNFHKSWSFLLNLAKFSLF